MTHERFRFFAALPCALAVAVAVLILIVCSPVSAQRITEWQTESGDWFEPKNWSNGVPNSKLPAGILNGAAKVEAGLLLRLSPSAAGLTIGGSSPLTKLSRADLEITGTNLEVLGALQVGQSNGTPVEGTLAIARGLARDSGNLYVTRSMAVGIVDSGKSSATGATTLEGSLLTDAQSSDVDIVVGSNKDSGHASGELTVKSAIGERGSINDLMIGWNDRSKNGSATGRVTAGKLVSDGAKSILAVGFNTGAGVADGYLGINDGISGFTQTLVGVATGEGTANGTIVINNGHFQSDTLIIGELLKEPSQTIRSRGHVTLNDSSFEGSSLIIGQGSELIADDLVESELLNAGSLRILGLPSAQQSGILAVQGNFGQTESGVTHLNINGARFGSEYESIRVSDFAELQGRLNLHFSEKYIPKLGQTFDLVWAPEMKGIPQLSLINPPADMAVRLDQRSLDGTVLFGELVRPSPLGYLNPLQSEARWSDSKIWEDGQLPTSIHQVKLVNANKEPQLITLGNAASMQSLAIAGNSADMKLSIVGDTFFSANNHLDIGANGKVELGSGATIAAATLDIRNGGALAGQGALIGSVNNRGLLQVGLSDKPSIMTIEGDYVQSQTGILDIDIAGLIDGEYDSLVVVGSANIGGLLSISFADGFVPEPGFSLSLIDATEGVNGRFHLLEPFGDFDNVEFGLSSGPEGEVILFSQQVDIGDFGDMNRDGEVNMCDIPAFGLALTDQIAYEQAHDGWSPFTRGNVDGDLHFDIDDRDEFLALVEEAPCPPELAAIPEPSGWCIALWLLGTMCVRIRRHGPTLRKGLHP